MAEQWLYNLVIFIQAGEGRGGLAAKKIRIDHRIDSFEILGGIVDGLTAEIFPDGVPDLPEHVQPIVPIHWTLVVAKQGPAVKPKDNGRKPIPPKH
jgi:hypothetical protein